MTQLEPLKPCPFCGGEAELQIDHEDKSAMVQCKQCFNGTPWCADESGLSFNKDMAIHAWQPRANDAGKPQQPAQEVVMLSSAVHALVGYTDLKPGMVVTQGWSERLHNHYIPQVLKWLAALSNTAPKQSPQVTALVEEIEVLQDMVANMREGLTAWPHPDFGAQCGLDARFQSIESVAAKLKSLQPFTAPQKGIVE